MYGYIPRINLSLFACALMLLNTARGQETNLNKLVSQLRDNDELVRAEAAGQIRKTLAEHPERRSRDNGREYWEKRIARVEIGMKHTDVVELLPSLTMQPADDLLHTGPGSADWRYANWRLDHYWTITILYQNPDRVRELPKLQNSAMDVWADPPEKYTGIWTTWFVNGQKSSQRSYRDGKYHGTLTVYHDNGNKSYEQHYEEGTCSGKDSGWNRDGTKMYEGQYVNGKQHGTWTHWYADGKLRSRTEHENGKYHGTNTSWFENGQARYERQYKQGKQHGTDRAWDKAGKQLWSRVYRNGEKTSG